MEFIKNKKIKKEHRKIAICQLFTILLLFILCNTSKATAPVAKPPKIRKANKIQKTNLQVPLPKELKFLALFT